MVATKRSLIRFSEIAVREETEMLESLKSLARGRRRCGVCLFELSARVKRLGLDVHHNWMSVFERQDVHGFSYTDLQTSTERGCRTCAALLSALQRFNTTFTTACWDPDLNVAGASKSRFLVISGSRQRFEVFTPSEHALDQGKPSLHPVVGQSHHLSDSTGDEGTIELTARWLDECRRSHQQCKAASESFVPTRLLNLGGEDHSMVELVESPAPSTVYAALSHRWTAETLATRLESSNLSRRKHQGIRLADLPRMMQDVVRVLRLLHIHHVWIDNMCIIQDDPDDWAREASTMASVYSNAELTVAATWCDRDGQSLFSDRGASNPSPTAVEIARVNGQPVLIRRALPHFQWSDIGHGWFADHPWISPDEEWPLLARGWVYQEQLLSRRMLHFTRHEVFWECYQKCACECAWHAKDAEARLPAGSAGNKRPVTSKQWTQIVTEYAGRPLSFETDRLHAIAGIARAIAEAKCAHPRSYVCGLWTDEAQLRETFFWYLRDPPTRPRFDPKMPSWSWASTYGVVEFWSYLHDEIDLTHAKAEFRGDASFMGNVESASVTLSGRMLPGAVHYGDDVAGLVKSSPAWARAIDVTPERWEDRAEADIAVLKVGEWWATFHPDYQLNTMAEGFVASGAPVLCVLVGVVGSSSYDPDSDVRIEKTVPCCLVLSCVDEERQRYQRIGFFRALDSIDDQWLDLDMFVGLSKRQQLTVV